MNRRHLIPLVCAVLGSLSFTAIPARGQTPPASAAADAGPAWPDRPIKLIVPYPPAGSTDAVTRLITEKIGHSTQWILLVDNRAGGNGNIGLDLVAKAKPDGYTLGMGQAANLAINPSLLGKMPYDAQKDFVPVALVASQPVVLVVRADSPWKTLADVVKAAITRPGEVTQALGGNGSVGHLAGELLAQRAGIKLLNVPYKGGSPAINELIGGQTDFMFATPQTALGMLRGGKLRALAVTSPARLPMLPDVPTVAESGYKGFEAMDWKALVAPAGTPPAVIGKLHAAVEAALAKPATIAHLLQDGSTPMSGSPAQVAQYLKAERARWAKVIRDAGIRLE